jgi:hypothetical protein
VSLSSFRKRQKSIRRLGERPELFLRGPEAPISQSHAEAHQLGCQMTSIGDELTSPGEAGNGKYGAVSGLSELIRSSTRPNRNPSPAAHLHLTANGRISTARVIAAG